MQICRKCGKERIVNISGKTSDCFDLTYKNIEYEGYVPSDIGIGDDSDYIQFAYCLDCGTIQSHLFPIEERIITEQIIEQ